MKKNYYIFILFTIQFHWINAIWAKDELVIIQAVSKTRRSFVIGKGIRDGIVSEQEIVFSNNNVSLVCRASEVNREYSLWVPVDKTILVPFLKDQIVSAQTDLESNLTPREIGKIKTEYSNILDLKVEKPDTSFHDDSIKKFRIENNISLKGGFNRSLTQSSSAVEEDKNRIRNGYNLVVEYHRRLIPQLEIGMGARFDYELYHIKEPELDIPTKRLMAQFSLTYHFLKFATNKNNFYVSIAGAVGQSETIVNEETAKGQVLILPEIRFGMLMPVSSVYAAVFETSIESVSANETFADDSKQKTNLINFRLSAGIRF